MDNVVLTARWVNSSLKKLATDPNLSYDQSAALFEAFTESIIKMIHNKAELSASEFLLACIAHFIFYDLKDKKYCLPTDLHERNSGVMYHRPLYYLDIEEAKERFNILFNDFLKQLSSHCDINEKKNLFSLFELVYELQGAGQLDRYIKKYRTLYICSKGKPRVIAGKKQNIGSFKLIPTTFIEHILYGHYSLDPKLAEEGHTYVNLCNAEEAAKLLGTSKINLIKKCLESSFGAYLRINSEKYKIKSFASFQYNQELIDEIIDPCYLYPYQGLVRLQKQSSFQDYLSLQAFYIGDGICWKYLSNKEQSLEDPLLIPSQFSLSETIQGNHKSIILHKDQKITIDDLVFIEDELSADKKSKKTKKMNIKTRTNKILEAFNKFMRHVKKHEIDIEQNNIPITKDELLSILNNHFSLEIDIENETIKDYLPQQGIKFKRGIKSNSPTYQKIINIL
ncbi:hypothetical protein SE924_10050 [Legionella pneumophila]|nr:hypothetical protein [Legionella pneumophila]